MKKLKVRTIEPKKMAWEELCECGHIRTYHAIETNYSYSHKTFLHDGVSACVHPQCRCKKFTLKTEQE